jgi:hypothetical protein
MVIGSMKLIKKDSTTNKCISYRFSSSISQNLYGCLNRNFFNPIIKEGEFLNIDIYDWQIRGYYREYDNSGIAVNLKLDYSDFYTQINSLINNDWVNENTYYVISIINFYSKNLNKLIIFKNTYELINNNFIYNNEIKISDLESTTDIWFVLAIIFSVFCIIFEFIQLHSQWGRLRKKSNENGVGKSNYFKIIKDIMIDRIFILISNKF